jgi:DNA-binding transcriptional MerR regulator
MENYLTTGEFASLCGVKKDTIFHYDDINLLKPDFIAPNGYRYYSPKQVMVFEIISALKAVGMSLGEIQRYSANQNSEEFLNLLKAKQAQLIEAQWQLAQTREFVEDTIHIISNSLATTLDEVSVVQCKEENLVITKTPSEDDMNNRTYWIALNELSQFCNNLKVGNVFPIGEIVKKEKFLLGRYRSDFYCSKPIRKVKSKRVITKPAGKYAVIYVRGSYRHLEAAYEKMRLYVKQNELKVVTDVFQQDQVYQFSNARADDYLMKISVGIE